MPTIALILALVLYQQPAPVQRPAEITISVDEYARLKSCEARELEAKSKKKTALSPVKLLIVAAAAAVVGVVAVSKKKKTGTSP